MKLTRKTALFLALTLSASLLSGCGGGDTNTPTGGGKDNVETITLRASSPTDPGTGWTVCLDTIAEEVYKNTNGKYKIDVYPNASLSESSEKTMTEQTYAGTLDMCVTPASLASAEWGAFSIPFQFDDRDHIWRVCETEVVQGMLDRMEGKGMKALGIVENGFFQITNNVKEIKVPADCKDIKLRTPQAQSAIDPAKMLGFNPVSISSGELYVALQQGTADAQQNALSTIYSKGFYDVQKYLTVINYNWSPALVGMNLDLWNSMDAETQDIFKAAIDKGCQVCNDKLAAEDTDYITKLEEKGMQVYVCTPEDIEAWKTALTNVAEVYYPSVGEELVLEFQKAVEDCRQ